MKFKYYIVYLEDATTYGTNNPEVVEDCRSADGYVVIDVDANATLSIDDEEQIKAITE
jgi:hypothetical protein